MKKNQLTCTDKGTRKTAIHKTHPYPPIPGLPPFRSIHEALEYIFIQYKANLFLEKEARRWKHLLDLSKRTMDAIEMNLKLKEGIIENLRMGDIPPHTYEGLTNALEEQRTDNLYLNKEIRRLKAELKKSRKFHYSDFILN